MTTVTKYLRGPLTYDQEPIRSQLLQINSKEPFNAEPPPEKLTESFITPTDLFYKRNHGPIPVLEDIKGYSVNIGGLVPRAVSLSMEDVKNLPKHTVVATLQCAGNRRTEMSLKKKVKGVGWGLAALGNAVWSGARLADVLALAGVPLSSSSTPMGGLHVEFISVDACKEENGGPYKASIPLKHASAPELEVLVAYEMNGEELNRDHGFPLRLIVPGVIGARSVKWITNILVRADECQGFFQQNDYKMFPPWIDWGNIDWSTRRPIMDFPVQSATCTPVDQERLSPGETTIRGYAISGSGRGIERVDVSLNGGKNWHEAKRIPQMDNIENYLADQEDSKIKWAWVFWEFKAVLPMSCDIVVRAVDQASSIQPENSEAIWNLRGVLNNSWHRIHVHGSKTESSNAFTHPHRIANL